MTDSAKLDLLLSEMQEMKTDMQEMKTGMQEMKQDIHLLKDDTQTLKENTQTLTQKVDVIEAKVIHTELILENEIRVNIQRVAEGHLDLSRNLHDAMRPSNEVEMLAIKVRMLESDVRELKSRLA
ncbi:MAG: hypothetical protein K2M70_04220 [Lachnospiraceae bacterium]|nr:hypothetical protein [Lachnospiraceae bacterium]